MKNIGDVARKASDNSVRPVCFKLIAGDRDSSESRQRLAHAGRRPACCRGGVTVAQADSARTIRQNNDFIGFPPADSISACAPHRSGPRAAPFNKSLDLTKSRF